MGHGPVSPGFLPIWPELGRCIVCLRGGPGVPNKGAGRAKQNATAGQNMRPRDGRRMQEDTKKPARWRAFRKLRANESGAN